MAVAYAFCGNPLFIEAVAPRLGEAGFIRTQNAAAADVVITFAGSQAELEELYFGSAGLVQELAPGTLLIDLSASAPALSREINAVATVSDLVMVEAPLYVENLALPRAFERTNLGCFVAGEGEVPPVGRRVLEALFSEVHEMGGPGAAQLARAARSLQVTAQAVSLIEGISLCRASKRSVSGTSVEYAAWMGASPAAASLAAAIEGECFEGQFTIEMLMAELAAALMAADDAELILPQAEASLHLLELLAVIGGSDLAPAALALVYGEEQACVEHGLDWSRADEAYGQDFEYGCGCSHEGDCECGGDEGDDEDGFGYWSN